jgi:hypothetical protein
MTTGVTPIAIRIPICGAIALAMAVAVARSELGNQVSESRGPPPKNTRLLKEATNWPSSRIQ